MFKSLLVGAFLASSAIAKTMGTRDTQFTCGTPAPSTSFIEVAKELAHNESTAIAHDPVTVKVWMHVVSKDETVEGGNIRDDTLHKQLHVLNKGFSKTGFSFSLQNITRRVDPNWSGDYWAKQPVRRGTYKDLNLYILPNTPDNSHGSCNYPGSDLPPGSPGFVYDGCSIRASTLPGGSDASFNRGATAIHQVGHWFGLLHTFEGGCGDDGDLIDDTPAEASPAQGCPVGIDTCGDMAGVDPIHNFMDFTGDACSEEFTPGQIRRIASSWNKYRAHPTTDGRPE